MSTIFDLKTNTDELSSTNEGTSRMEYEQHPPTRDVVGKNFANGAIHFRFQTSGQKWWMPSRSYIRTRFTFTAGDDSSPAETNRPVNLDDQVAPNMGMMSNLFQSGEMRINDKTVSRVSDFMPQVDALETRLTKSKSWLESVGEATNWWEENQQIRQNETASDGSLITNPFVGATEVTTARTAMGFDAAGGVDATKRNQWGYTAATGVLVYDQGTDTAGLNAAAASLEFPVGSFFKYVGVAGTPEALMEVLANDGAGNLVVDPALNANVLTDGRNDFSRVVKTGATASPSRQVGVFETVWIPPLSLFKVEHALPSGRYELVLNPQTATAYQKRAIESALGIASKNPTQPNGTTQDYKISIVDMYLYTATVEGPRNDDVTYLLDLEQTRCQSEKIDTASFQQKNFDVSPSTYALTVAYQDLRAGENTALSASKFKSYEVAAIPATPSTNQELKLDRFFINYAGQNLPAPDADPSFKAGTDYTIQRYSESQIYSGGYFDTGGAETIQEFHDRGAYYYFAWPRDGTDRSTRVNVHQKFDGADVTNMRLLLFDHSKQVARIRVQDGRVVDVQVEDS
jgi:hypothetical protein